MRSLQIAYSFTFTLIDYCKSNDLHWFCGWWPRLEWNIHMLAVHDWVLITSLGLLREKRGSSHVKQIKQGSSHFLIYPAKVNCPSCKNHHKFIFPLVKYCGKILWFSCKPLSQKCDLWLLMHEHNLCGRLFSLMLTTIAVKDRQLLCSTGANPATAMKICKAILSLSVRYYKTSPSCDV